MIHEEKPTYVITLTFSFNVYFLWEWWISLQHQALWESNGHYEITKCKILCIHIRISTSDKYRWHQLLYGLLPQEKHFVMQMYEPNTCFSNSHTNNNLQTGLLKAFWNGYLFSVCITGLIHWCSLCYWLLGNVPMEPSTVFKRSECASFHWRASQSGIPIWSFVLHTHCHVKSSGLTDWYLNTPTGLLVGTKDEVVLLWIVLFQLLLANSFTIYCLETFGKYKEAVQGQGPF